MDWSFQRVLLLLAAGCTLLLSSCSYFNETDTADTSVFSGQVIHESTGNPLKEALVRIIQPQELQQSTITDDDGRFTLPNVQVDDDLQITLEISKNEFSTRYRQLAASPGSEIDTGNIEMKLLSEVGDNGDGNDNGNDNGGDSDEASDESGGAAVLVMTNISEQSISIQETGGDVISKLTFSVQDSSGRSITRGRSETVWFEIVSGPDDGEGLTPDFAETDDQGSVSMNLISGYSAGVVKVQALIEREDIGLTIRSKPIAIAIHGGYPDQDYFSLSLETLNFEGWAIDGARNQVRATVGDKFSNPVKPGTPVYFSTTAGIIQGSGVTNEDGEVIVDLISGNPRPAGGYAEISAVTYDESGHEVSEVIPVLLSGPPSANKITVTPDSFNIPADGGQTYTLTVTDINDNPLPRGTTVTVELESEILTLSGDTDITIPNTLDAGTGVTEFTFSVRDHDDENVSPQEYDITISVVTPAGYSGSRTFSD